MNNFEFHNPTKIIFGDNAMDKIAENIKPFGKKVLITFGGGSIIKNGIYNKIIDQLKDFEVMEFGGIEPNPRVETIRKAVELYKKFNPDFVLAIGGGSVIDGTKLIVSAMFYEGDPWDFMIKENVQPSKYIPFGTVLTLSATGSEMNSGAVITNWTKHEKLFFGRKETYPVFSILDPKNTFTVPKDQTAYGIIDTYSHILEQYLTTSKDIPLQDRFGEGILLTLIENAPKVLANPEDYIARANITFCACMALNGLIRSGTNEDWATHRIEHEISAFYDIPHAAGLAMITPRWMSVVTQQKGDKIVQYGKRIWNLSGNKDEIIKQSITKTYEFFASLGVKMNFKEWNITTEHYPVMIKRLVDGKVGETPLTEEQITTILNKCIE